jgi:hypothetical protein
MSAALDLTRCASASLELLRFADVQLDTGEFLRLQLWDGTAWVTAASWEGGVSDDDTWHHEIFDLAAYSAVSSFRVRFVTKQNGTVEHVHVDDVRIIGQSCTL